MESIYTTIFRSKGADRGAARPYDFLLICWLFFVGYVTWLDWVGMIGLLIAGVGIVATQVIYLGIASAVLCRVVAAIRTIHYSYLQRSVLVFSLIWLLVLPFIPWDATKAMITRSALLVPGMTKAQVQARMTTFPGVHDVNNKGEVFCTDGGWKYSQCTYNTAVVRMEYLFENQLETVEIEFDD